MKENTRPFAKKSVREPKSEVSEEPPSFAGFAPAIDDGSPNLLTDWDTIK